MAINIAEEFSRHPSGRVPSDGPDNGERFRQEHLIPALKAALATKDSGRVVVDIDGCRSFGSSFLEEAFGGLSRVPSFPFHDAVKLLKIRCTKPHLKIYHDAILHYLNEARTKPAAF